MIYNKCVLISFFLWWTLFTDPSFEYNRLLINKRKKSINEEIIVNPFNRFGYGFGVFFLFSSEKRLPWSKALQAKKWNLFLILHPLENPAVSGFFYFLTNNIRIPKPTSINPVILSCHFQKFLFLFNIRLK